MLRNVKSIAVPVITMTLVAGVAFLVRLGLALEYVR
jgi:hypothetical protein